MRVYETKNLLGQSVIAQVQYGSTNSKTGDGIQIWILPSQWVIEGKNTMDSDEASCLDCPHSKRGTKKCYVRKGNAEMGLKSKVNSLHNKFLKGELEILPMSDLSKYELSKIRGKFVRFGAYGEPVLLGLDNVKAITEASSSWTGYTHQWRNPSYMEYQKYFMASVETMALEDKAHELGWRVFHVTDKDTDAVKGKEINCPASAEFFKANGKKVTCNTCGLCRGTSIKAKSIQIKLH